MKNLAIKVNNDYNKSIIAVNYFCGCGYSFTVNKYTFLSHLLEEPCYVYILGCDDGKIRYRRQAVELSQYIDLTKEVFKNYPTIF